MRVAVVHTITEDLVSKLFIKRIDTLIYIRVNSTVNLNELAKKIKLIYAYHDAPLINDFSFDYVSNTLAAIKTKNPGIFTYKGYDLTHALEKDMFWGLLENNAIKYHVDNLEKEGHKIFNYFSRQPLVKRLALWKKLFLGKNTFSDVLLPAKGTIEAEDSVAFRVNQLELGELYGNLFEKIKGRDVISFQNSNLSDNEELEGYLKSIFRLNIRCNRKQFNKNAVKLKHRATLAMIKVESDFVNVLTTCLFRLINDVEQYEKLIAFGIKKFFLAASENEGEGNVLCLIVQRHNGLIFNYMNGAKAREKINIHTYFTHWFMPNEVTQKLILSYCDVTEKQVPVIGHLLEEKAHNYKYQGSLDIFEEQLTNKKIIAFFTSTVFIKEQNDVLNFLVSYLSENSNLVVLIRKHPSDTRTEIIKHERIITLQDFSKDLYNISLFDLLFKADISISFSSTVSLQSTWFDLLTLNFDYAEESVLPYVDNKRVLHINSIKLLEATFKKNLLLERTLAKQKIPVSASDNIVNIIWPEYNVRR